MKKFEGEENARLFAMRKRAERTVKLLKTMNDTFPANPDENMVLVIMASNFDSFWEGLQWNADSKNKKL
jgi:hypothetical protein